MIDHVGCQERMKLSQLNLHMKSSGGEKEEWMGESYLD